MFRPLTLKNHSYKKYRVTCHAVFFIKTTQTTLTILTS